MRGVGVKGEAAGDDSGWPLGSRFLSLVDCGFDEVASAWLTVGTPGVALRDGHRC